MNAAGKLALLSGGGAAPRALVKACRAKGLPVFVIGLEGQADVSLDADVWLGLGALGALKKICEKEGIGQIVMLGSVRRPFLSELRTDWLGVKVVAKIGLSSFGDDGLLRAVVRVLEEECAVKIVGAHEVFSEILAPEGVLTKTAPNAQNAKDIERGLQIARALGALDVGQAAIVHEGIVLGVEAVEGTDALIERAGKLRRGGKGGVLVKTAKPKQDSRFDLPSIGPETLKNLARAGFAGVAIEAGRSLLIESGETIKAANEAGLFVVGVGS